MAGFQCPFCSMIMPISKDTQQDHYPSFDKDDGTYYPSKGGKAYYASCLKLAFYKCPNCNQITITAKGMGESVNDVDMLIHPKSLAQQFPDYIPEAIRQDYEEAYSIVFLSPKASATLSRRCLQGMIRDFWEIKESNLSKAIEKLEDKIPAAQWKVIDGIRRIGNIGAHMEKDISLIVDIDPDEARKLLKLIEPLMEQWYINRHDQEQLYSDILAIDETKQEARKNKD